MLLFCCNNTFADSQPDVMVVSRRQRRLDIIDRVTDVNIIIDSIALPMGSLYIVILLILEPYEFIQVFCCIWFSE